MGRLIAPNMAAAVHAAFTERVDLQHKKMVDRNSYIVPIPVQHTHVKWNLHTCIVPWYSVDGRSYDTYVYVRQVHCRSADLPMPSAGRAPQDHKICIFEQRKGAEQYKMHSSLGALVFVTVMALSVLGKDAHRNCGEYM